MASVSGLEPVENSSLLARVFLKTLQNKQSLIEAHVTMTAEELMKYATSQYTKWFTTKPGHSEAMSELKHLCDVINNSAKEVWSPLIASIKKRTFFVHIVYSYLLQKENICEELQLDVAKELEAVLQGHTQVFKELAMESEKRKMTVCNAVIQTTTEDALAQDFAHTIHHGVPLMRATEEAYDLVTKYFPHRKMSASSDLKALLAVIDDEIDTLEQKCQRKTEEAQDKTQMVDMLKMVANQLRRQLDQKDFQFQCLDKKVDDLSSTVKTVLDEVRENRHEKIHNVDITSSETKPKAREPATQPAGEVACPSISRLDISGVDSKDISSSGSMN